MNPAIDNIQYCDCDDDERDDNQRLVPAPHGLHRVKTVEFLFLLGRHVLLRRRCLGPVRFIGWNGTGGRFGHGDLRLAFLLLLSTTLDILDVAELAHVVSSIRKSATIPCSRHPRPNARHYA